MLTKSKILEILKKIQPQLKSAYGVQKLALFGSYATGTAREGSDVDLLVELDRPIGFKFFQMIDYLEEKLGEKLDILTPEGVASIRIKEIAESIRRSLIYV
ncbi:MAG: nucleotidyltransferase family protein [Deltaproteobacteria bacterium]|nr:nucleotidyltransferase family protein [Deltaproteobacteria bacterium]